MNDDLRAAKARLASARGWVRMYSDRTIHMNELARSRRLEHDEMIQLAHQFRATQVARNRAVDDAQGWRRIVNILEGRNPEHKGSVSLTRTRAAKPGYLASGHKGSVSLSRESVSLGHRGSISLSRTAGPGYLTRMMGSS
jgi:hypothetical protein